jgi:hypothetical protein
MQIMIYSIRRELCFRAIASWALVFYLGMSTCVLRKTITNVVNFIPAGTLFWR